MRQTKSIPIGKMQVWEAYQRVRANRGSAGVDGISIEAFDADLKNQLYKLWNRLSSGSYFPPPVREVKIPKKDGSQRKLGIPTVGDRVAQMVVRQHLEPKVEPLFHPDSYGYRPGRSAHMALALTKDRCWKMPWVLDLDLRKFFDTLDHHLLMHAVRKHTQEKWVLMYIERWLKAPVQQTDGSLASRTMGSPQGAVISPLLANIFLHHAFDQWMQREFPAAPFERYADDIVVHCSSHREAATLLEQIRKRMHRCKLELHPEKTQLVYCRRINREQPFDNVQFTFLEYTFQPRRVKTRRGELILGFGPAISQAAKRKISRELRNLQIHRWTNATIEEIARKLNPKLRGWLNYYGRFRPSALRGLCYNLNQRLLKWVTNRYKQYRHNKKGAIRWLRRVAQAQPQLFAHWSFGFPP